ncbi:unnamed protein product [Leptidea sinapis]|uniref:Major facilitator superfamily (MFS) profile domain-containing protein n=1 Tax=Leptidea sinapis TaxID=189913 RepID=A0A5E4QGB7_9NEOP|nr:unnamed protein product [Leptidea sinapis]
MSIQPDLDSNKTEMDDKEEMNEIGSALEAVINSVGGLGLYQKILFIAMMPFGIAWAFLYFCQMFVTATPDVHWCRVPELDSLSMEMRRSLVTPTTGNYDFDKCNTFDTNWTQVLESLRAPEAGTPTIPCPYGWEFQFEDIPYSTVVSERGWVCDRAYLVPWSQSISFVGSVIGGIVCGMLADKYGRLPALVLANVFGIIGNVGTIFTTGFWDFSICRFIAGMSVDSCFLLIYILVLEYVGTRYRTWVSNLSIALFFGGGCVLLPWVALWISDWKWIMFATAVPSVLVFLTPFLVPESARWLISKGRVDKAVTVLKRFEKMNGNKIPDNVMEKFVTIAKTRIEKEDGISLIFKTPSLRIMVVFLIIAFMAVAVMFDGIIRMSENLGMDFFVTFAVTSATEIPSIIVLLFLLDRLGRRWLVYYIGVSGCYRAVLQQHVVRVHYPVDARADADCCESFRGVLRAHHSFCCGHRLSLIIVGVVGLAGASLALFLPETKGKHGVSAF